MNDVTFYGFQYPHHGNFSSFKALSHELEALGAKIVKPHYPPFPGWLPSRVRTPLCRQWFKANELRIKCVFKAGSTVHYFYPENSLFRAPFWKRSGRLVLTCHQPVAKLMDYQTRGMLKPFFEGLKAADVIVLMAPNEIEEYRRFAPNSQIIYIPHGVDSHFFSPYPVFAKHDGRLRILTVGNWLRDYRMWAQVVDHVIGQRPDFEFSVLANRDVIADALSGCRHLCDKIRVLHGISDDQLRDEYRRADVLFIPLLDAWANNALLEGMACGRPVVITDLPAIRGYAGDTVCYISKGDIATATAFLIELGDNPKRRQELGIAARRKVEEGLSWSVIAKRHSELYSSL